MDSSSSSKGRTISLSSSYRSGKGGICKIYIISALMIGYTSHVGYGGVFRMTLCVAFLFVIHVSKDGPASEYPDPSVTRRSAIVSRFSLDSWVYAVDGAQR